MHQGALYYSLHLLFEKRLGWDLFRPIGIDWRKEGYWQYSQLEDTIKQYLEVKTLDTNLGHYFECPDRDFDWTQKALTFPQFLKTDIDVILCSVGPHEDTFFDLMQRHKPKAKLVRQIGNWNEEVDFNKSKNIMCSVGPFVCPEFVNHINYHQEFDTKFWKYKKPKNIKTIRTFINCFPDSVDAHLWKIYKDRLSEFNFKMHGIGGKDGNVYPQAKVRETMADSGFIWHVKLGGEGYGHVIHNAFALGRPVITKGSYYQGKMAEPLLIHGKTCIDLDQGDLHNNIAMIRHFSKPFRFRKMSKNAYKRFKEVCDFDREEKYIREFLKKLL